MRLKTIGLLLAALVALPAVGASAAPARANPSLAHFEGRTIDLRVSWEEATACTSDGVATWCFRTEAEMDAFLAAQGKPTGVIDVRLLGIEVSVALSCSPSVRVYAATSYIGTTINLTTAGVAHNMSTYGLDNQVSSYKVGACDAEFYDGANRTGTAYPGNTNAWALGPSMTLGWDNRVSSIWIYP